MAAAGFMSQKKEQREENPDRKRKVNAVFLYLGIIRGGRVSKTATALLVKFFMTFILAVVTLSFMDGNRWGWVFLISLVATAINYLIGDTFALIYFGDFTSAAGEGVMGALTAYVLSLFTPVFQVSPNTLIIFGFLLAAGEYFFHRFLIRSGKVFM